MSVFQTVAAGLNGKRSKIAIREGTERSFAETDHPNWSHIL